MLFLLLGMVSIPTVYAIPAITVSAETIQPKSDRIAWRFATINGVKCKRLHNYTKGVWIGDWIPVG